MIESGLGCAYEQDNMDYGGPEKGGLQFSSASSTGLI